MGHNRAGVNAKAKLRRRRREEVRLAAKETGATKPTAKPATPTGARKP